MMTPNNKLKKDKIYLFEVRYPDISQTLRASVREKNSLCAAIALMNIGYTVIKCLNPLPTD